MDAVQSLVQLRALISANTKPCYVRLGTTTPVRTDGRRRALPPGVGTAMRPQARKCWSLFVHVLAKCVESTMASAGICPEEWTDSYHASHDPIVAATQAGSASSPPGACSITRIVF